MNLAACVILYNPDSSVIKNINSYFYSGSPIRHLYISDNSTYDNSYMFDDIKEITYMPNYNNEGIAKALNQTCQKAINDGYEYIMTMDQDSYFIDNNFIKYIKEIQNNLYKADSFAPNTVQPENTLALALKIKKKLQKTVCNFAWVDRCITSGNVISLKSWKEIGGFNEELFIDQVDFDYCFRLAKYKGKKRDKIILKFQNIFLTHTIGIPKHKLLPEFDAHSGIRVYYIFRNMLYIKKNHSAYFTYKNYIFLLKFYFKHRFNIETNMYLKKAIFDYKHNIYGKYEK